MKLLRFTYQHALHAGVLENGRVVPMQEINARRGLNVPNDLLKIIEQNSVDQLRDLGDGFESVPVTEIKPLLPYDVPPKIWCIGLNYHSHADGHQRRAAGGTRQFHEAGILHVPARRRDRAAAARILRRRGCRRRTRRGHRHDLPLCSRARASTK